MKIHVIQCGSIRVSGSVPFGNRLSLAADPACSAVLCSHDPGLPPHLIEI